MHCTHENSLALDPDISPGYILPPYASPGQFPWTISHPFLTLIRDFRAVRGYISETSCLRQLSIFVVGPNSLNFCRAMLCKRGLCRHAVSVCLSVRPSVTFVYSVETNKHIFNNIFHHRVATPLYSFSVSKVMAIFRRRSLTGASKSVGKNRDVSQYLTPSRAVNGSTAKCNTFSSDGLW